MSISITAYAGHVSILRVMLAVRATDQGGGVKIRKIMDSAGAVLNHALN